MTKFGWFLTLVGFLAILSSILYPLDVISKQTVLILLFGGAGTMFVGSMIRNLSLLKKSLNNWMEKGLKLMPISIQSQGCLYDRDSPFQS